MRKGGWRMAVGATVTSLRRHHCHAGRRLTGLLRQLLQTFAADHAVVAIPLVTDTRSSE